MAPFVCVCVFGAVFSSTLKLEKGFLRNHFQILFSFSNCVHANEVVSGGGEGSIPCREIVPCV